MPYLLHFVNYVKPEVSSREIAQEKILKSLKSTYLYPIKTSKKHLTLEVMDNSVGIIIALHGTLCMSMTQNFVIFIARYYSFIVTYTYIYPSMCTVMDSTSLIIRKVPLRQFS